MEKKVIFIAGTSYSGSTLLDMIIANDIHGFSLGEIGALFRPYRKYHLQLRKEIRENEQNIYHAVLSGKEKNIYKNLFNVLNNIAFLVDSSKDVFWIKSQMSNLDNLGIKYKLILIYKTPYELAKSFSKRNILDAWVYHYISYYRKFLVLFNDYYLVKYKDLISKEETLKELCNYLDISYFKEKKNFWEKEHNTLFGNNRARISVRGLDVLGIERISNLNQLPQNVLEKDNIIDNNIIKVVDYDLKKNLLLKRINDYFSSFGDYPVKDITYSRTELLVRKYFGYFPKRLIWKVIEIISQKKIS